MVASRLTGLGREVLVKGPVASTRVTGVGREVLAKPQSANVRATALAREVLRTAIAAPSSTRIALLAREVLMPSGVSSRVMSWRLGW